MIVFMHWIPCAYETIHWHSKIILAGYSLVGNPTDFVYVGIYTNYVLRILFGLGLMLQSISFDHRRRRKPNNCCIQLTL